MLDTIYVRMSFFLFVNNILSETSNYFVTVLLNLVIKAVIKSLLFKKKQNTTARLSVGLILASDFLRELIRLFHGT